MHAAQRVLDGDPLDVAAGQVLLGAAEGGQDQRLTAVITRDAIDELKLRRGDEALAIIKSTEVMIGLES